MVTNWIYLEAKIYLETKSNVQKESNTLEGIKGKKRAKWKKYKRWLDGYGDTYMFLLFIKQWLLPNYVHSFFKL